MNLFFLPKILRHFRKLLMVSLLRTETDSTWKYASSCRTFWLSTKIQLQLILSVSRECSHTQYCRILPNVVQSASVFLLCERSNFDYHPLFYLCDACFNIYYIYEQRIWRKRTEVVTNRLKIRANWKIIQYNRSKWKLKRILHL